MKKVTKSRTRAKGNTDRKPKSGKKDVDSYLASVPEPGRTTLKKIREVIRAAAPKEAIEAIGYRIPMFRYKGGLVAYAAFSQHCSFFPMSLAVIATHKQELKPYLTSKGTLQFPLNKPLPAALVKKIVKARVAEKDRKK
jgi:uncharacterized protein YdhG (YjbR/CyaY superfamily)